MTTRKNAVAAVETPSIVLKVIHDDIMKDNASSTLTTKKMRVVLRAKMNEVHIRNSSWIFTQSQYDTVRAMFDPAYAKKVAASAKRAAKVKTSAPADEA